MTTTVRITSVVEGTDSVHVSFIREPAGIRGTIEFPTWEPWMVRGERMIVRIEPVEVAA